MDGGVHSVYVYVCVYIYILYVCVYMYVCLFVCVLRLERRENDTTKDRQKDNTFEVIINGRNK